MVADGQLYWMLDTYTHTSSSRHRLLAATRAAFGNWLNYVRNSVKVVINAYDGSISFTSSTQ